jgi:hypothetical protein
VTCGAAEAGPAMSRPQVDVIRQGGGVNPEGGGGVARPGSGKAESAYAADLPSVGRRRERREPGDSKKFPLHIGPTSL